MRLEDGTDMPKSKLTCNENEVLEIMSEGEWYRPMDLGGWDGSHHSRTLKRLCDKGLVERKPRNTLNNVLMLATRRDKSKPPKRAASWCYRVTSAGLVAVGVIPPESESRSQHEGTARG